MSRVESALILAFARILQDSVSLESSIISRIWCWTIQRNKKSRLTEELEDLRLIKHAVNWQMEFDVN